MRRNFTQLYVHLVWATWDRLPLITPTICSQIYSVMTYECQQLKCTVVAVGGVEDHVHLLTSFPANVSISRLVKQVKGSVSHCVTRQHQAPKFFKWQGSYAAFTVNHRDLNPIAVYIHNQREHHQHQTTISNWEIPIKEHP
ncbi:IS200/IS605 family transposase [Acaryochloris thomasi]|uniref:IS200/IS605 family transposase n=1 Tax=Acaryochloris thomasi TaxID=2929456 RepID=UPI000DA6B1AA|nr:IS200/IS605 family transposase [Acaryochloris thomasi]